MTTLNLTGQLADVQSWLPSFQAFEAAIDNRLVVWNKISPEKRQLWLKAAAGTRANPKTLQQSKDPVMWLAVRVYRKFQDIEIAEGED